MERSFVSSSNLYSVGYDHNTSVLEVEFRNGGIYQYFGVPFNIYDSLMKARSHGEYFSAYIRNRYRWRRVW